MRRPWPRLLVLAALLAAAGLGALLLRGPRRSLGSPLTLVVEPGEGLAQDVQMGLALLIRDHLEVRGHASVLEGGAGPPSPRDSALLSLRPRREGEQLALDGFYRPRSGPERPIHALGPPREALAALLGELGISEGGNGRLIPGEARDGWELLALMGIPSEWELDPKVPRAQALVRRNPGCASAELTLGVLLRRRLNAQSDAGPDFQEQCRLHFERGLALQPDHPRGAHEFAYFLTDSGDQRGALELLFRTLQIQPRMAVLWGALAYPARTAGLLDGARAALEARDRFQGRPQAEANLADNAYLYAGDWERFERSLGTGEGLPPDALLDFYRGYVRLIRGDRAGALTRFRRAGRGPSTVRLFAQLAHVFQLGLEDRPSEARAELDAFREQRRRLRVPDGEFTFKLAEAYAFLGQEEEALLMAERAFDQGFSCREWYAGSPLLGALRPKPRWRALLQHVQERQGLLESRFPLGRFRP